ncbi:MAG: hypothetical protein QOI24_2578 [Acidobacteriota bacterium]|jgi:hypothetical protein|nr:hypothetical protein [Acidobacteriota bacterium]
MDRATRFRIRDGVMFNRVGDEIVLLDLDKGTYLGLDPVGSRFWELVTANASLGEAIETMLGEYEVARPELEADVDELVDDLARNELLTAAG